MLTLMDWLGQIEYRRLSLTRTGQERLEQLAYAKQAAGKPKKKVAVRPKTQAVTSPCCQATIA
jgi:hypothetical protein